MGWQDLLDAGSEAEARKRAQQHTEGKEYVVRDGDVVHVPVQRMSLVHAIADRCAICIGMIAAA